MERPDYLDLDDPQETQGWISDPFKGERFDVPLGDFDEFPQACLNVSKEWVPFILGALERLKYGDMWAGDAADIQRAYENVTSIQAELSQGICEGGNMNYECYDMPLHSPIIDWHPNDPYDSPDFIPTGYSCPPWHVADAPNPVAGVHVGDVYFDPLCALVGFPPFIPLSGVPRLRIHVQGPADVDIEFVDVFQGGIAIIFVDGFPVNWHNCKLYSLTELLNVESWSDLFGIAVDALTKPVEQDQISISGTGEHIIEIQFFPRVTIDTSIGWGGGIRSVQICSTEEQVDLSNFVTDVRINGGTVEKQIGGVWTQVAVTDNNDLIAENELRDDGCQLQYYDLTDHTWHDIPGADYLSVSDPCPITKELNLWSTGLTQLRISDTDGPYDFTLQQNGLDIYFKSARRMLFYTENNKHFLTFYETGLIATNQDPGPTFVHGHVTFNDYLSSNNMTLRATSATPSVQFQCVDKDGRITNQITVNGWQSLLEQLIVNDYSSTGTLRGLGRLLGQWADSTDATRKGRMILQADDWNGVREGLRVEADGGYPMLGFFGGSAITQPIVIGSDAATALQSLLTALSGMNLIDDQTEIDEDLPYGEVTVIPDSYEAHWNIIDAFPGNDWEYISGTYYAATGLVSDILGGNSGMEVRRQISEYQQVHRWKFQFNVAYIGDTGIHLELYDDAGAGHLLAETDINADGAQYVEFAIDRQANVDYFRLVMTSAGPDESSWVLVRMWEIGRNYAAVDNFAQYTEIATQNSVTDVFNITS